MKDINTWLLLLCIGLLIYLIYRKFQLKEIPHSFRIQRFKSVTKISSEKSILSLPKVTEISWRPKKVNRICITGGPCAGKTTSLARLSSRLPEMGYKVFTVPEAATLLRSGGAMININHFDNTQKINFQLRLVKLQLALEDVYTSIAERCGDSAIVICDRGVMDGSAYISSDLWQALLDEMGLTQVHLRDCRYDAVIHLVTSAQGAEQHFSNRNNLARYEDIEEARNIDRLLQRAWTGHLKMYIVDNERVKSFDEKIHKCIEIVLNHLNLPSSNHFNHKFLLKKPETPDIKFPDHIKFQKISVEETFLNHDKERPGVLRRIQRRGYQNSYTYLFIKELYSQEDPNKHSTESTIISSRDYLTLMKLKDTKRKTVLRELLCFIYEDDYMIVDTFLNIMKGLTLLRIQTKKSIPELSLPPFLDIIRSVTDELGYSTYVISKESYYLPESDEGKI